MKRLRSFAVVIVVAGLAMTQASAGTGKLAIPEPVAPKLSIPDISAIRNPPTGVNPSANSCSSDLNDLCRCLSPAEKKGNPVCTMH